jgi:hypothetical protein
LGLTPSGAAPAQAGARAGFPWGIAAAAGVSALGTALFWYFVA